jgi:hypothetical protein
MSRKYYYLIASLPTITFDNKPPLSCEEFLAVCKPQLASQDFQLISQAILDEEVDPRSSNGVFRQWSVFNHHLRNEMTYFRARRAGKDPVVYMRGERSSDSVFADVVAQAAKAADPLSSERIFDRSRWQLLEEMGRYEYFSLEFLLIYALKLRILERYQTIESPKGKAIFADYKNINIPLN